MRSHRYALILAGGRGTRFWPRSRTLEPKQLLSFFGERSLLQETVERLKPLVPPERIWILANEHLRKQITKQLPEVPPKQILAEPAQRNTAPCMALGAHLIEMADPDAVLGIFPADHYITNPAHFRHFVDSAYHAAEQDKLVTLGIQPRWPETGYGYLELPKGVKAGSTDAVKLRSFREKPELAKAKRFLKAGNFFWNAGMFFWRASAFLDQVRTCLPRTAALVASLPPVDARSFTTKLRDAYPHCDNISVDYGVMEKSAAAGKVWAIATDDFGWNDVGSWNAVYELHDRLEHGHAFRSHAVFHDSRGCYVDVPGKTVALVGVEDLVIVETPDALLVTTRARAQDVGQIVKQIEKSDLTKLL
ncbi:MAG: mannose-1-phosphate guanylyltransferase [Bryobacteraceae bacterium]